MGISGVAAGPSPAVRADSVADPLKGRFQRTRRAAIVNGCRCAIDIKNS